MPEGTPVATPPIRYDREAAVNYAHQWAYGRNPAYYDYEKLGGDCTNFASQCLFAGLKVMNYTPTFGWYYIDGNRKAPAWTGVPYFYNFLTRKPPYGAGPIGKEVTIEELEPGDFVQLMLRPGEWNHTPIVTAVGDHTPERILVAAHSYDADCRPLSSYQVIRRRYLHVLGGFPNTLQPGRADLSEGRG